MAKYLFAAAAALALMTAQPVRADEGCQHCPQHKMAAGEKKEGQKPAACACHGGEAKECKCGEKCGCGHCQEHKAGKEEKKAS